MNSKINKRLPIMTLVIGLIVGTGIVVTAANFEPGSNEDPIVSKSYVDKAIADNNLYMETRITEIEEAAKNFAVPDATKQNKLQVVEVEGGKKLILDEGAAFILRGGKATIIDSQLGGILDMTQGKDLRMGWDVPANHYLIVPRPDGRGANCDTDAIFMVFGNYRIEE